MDVKTPETNVESAGFDFGPTKSQTDRNMRGFLTKTIDVKKALKTYRHKLNSQFPEPSKEEKSHDK